MNNDIINYILSFTPIRNPEYETVLTEMKNYFETEAYTIKRYIAISTEIIKYQMLYSKYIILELRRQAEIYETSKESAYKKVIDKGKKLRERGLFPMSECLEELETGLVKYQNHLVHTDHSYYSKPTKLRHLRKRNPRDIVG